MIAVTRLLMLTPSASGSALARFAHDCQAVTESLAAIGDSVFDTFAIRHAAGDIGVLDEIATTFILREWADSEAIRVQIGFAG